MIMQRAPWTWGAGMGLLMMAAGCNSCGEDLAKAPGSVAGVLCQANGRLAVGATVTAAVGDESRVAVTAGDGAFLLENVPAGSATLSFDGEGQRGRPAETVTVTSDARTAFVDTRCLDPDRDVGKGCITGQVCNRHTGALVSGGTVSVVLQDAPAGAMAPAPVLTDAQGLFQVCNVPEGGQVVTVRAAGFTRSYAANVVAGQSTEVVAGGTCTPFDPMAHCMVRGRICEDGTPRAWLGGARVTAVLLGAGGTPVMPLQREAQEEFSDEDGRYELFLRPGGRWRVEARKGNFVSRHEVDCTEGAVTEVAEGDQCLTPGECRFVVAQGVFDRVEDVLGRVGVPAAQVELVDGNPVDLSDWAQAAFGDASRLEGVCGVFINCGVDEAPFRGPTANQAVIQNLRAFVEAGGTLYASDQSYDVLEALLPDKVDFLGNDDVWNAAEGGLPAMLNASVMDGALQSYLAQQAPTQQGVDINLAYQGWSVVQRVDADVQVYLRADVTVCTDGEACTQSRLQAATPMALRFAVGAQGGQVIFTSFHVENPAGDGGMVSTTDTDRVMRFLVNP